MVEHTDTHLKIFFRISLVTLRVAVVAAVLAAEPRIEPADVLLEVLRAEAVFLEDVLKCQYGGRNADSLQSDTIQGLGLTFTFHRQPCHQHYAAQHPDNLLPLSPAFAAMKYGDNQSACVAYNGTDYRALTMGFPFECIRERREQEAIMRGLLKFLLP